MNELSNLSSLLNPGSENTIRTNNRYSLRAAPKKLRTKEGVPLNSTIIKDGVPLG
jgi:hypothetical protein